MIKGPDMKNHANSYDFSWRYGHKNGDGLLIRNSLSHAKNTIFRQSIILTNTPQLGLGTNPESVTHEGDEKMNNNNSLEAGKYRYHNGSKVRNYKNQRSKIYSIPSFIGNIFTTIGRITDRTKVSHPRANNSYSVRKHELVGYEPEYTMLSAKDAIEILPPGKQGLINGNHMDNHEKFYGLTNGNGLIDVDDAEEEFGQIFEKDHELHMNSTDSDNIIDAIVSKKRFQGYPSRCTALSKISGRKIRLITILLAFLIVAASMIILVRPRMDDRIRIDGNFSDWNSIPGCPDPLDEDLDPSLDILQIRISTCDHYMSFFLQARDNLLNGMGTNGETIRIFIDYDHDTTTGYSLTGLGADILIELYGLKGMILSSTSYVYDTAYRSESARNNHDWNAWAPLYDVHGEIEGNRMEVQIWKGDPPADRSTIPTCLVQTMGISGDFDISPILSEAGSLDVQVQSLLNTNTITQNLENPLLKLKIRSICGKGIIINSISFSLYLSLNGTIIKSSSLHCDASAVVYNASIECDRLFFTTEEDLTDSVVSEWSYTLRITLTRTVITGQTLHIGLSEMDTAAGITPINNENAFAYISSPPDTPMIDGIFDEWCDPIEDSHYDSSDPSIDLMDYDAIRSGDEHFFYARTDRDIISGMTIPLRGPISMPSQDLVDHSDHHYLPVDDIQNSLPESGDMDIMYIFIDSGDPESRNENVSIDGIQGERSSGRNGRSESGDPNDSRENDGRSDTNESADQNLNDENVGCDESIENDDTGYDLNHDFQADHLIEIKGRNGEVLSKTFLRFTGNSNMDWNWTYHSSPKIWINDCQLETSIIFPGDIRCLFHLVSWNEESTDTADTIIDGHGGASINNTIRIRSSESGVCINEIMPNPELESNEWIELFNPRDTIINLTSWTLTDESGIIWTGESGDMIGSQNFFNVSISNKLKNSGETLTLFNEGEEQSDMVRYPTFTSYEGFSFSRIVNGSFYFERDPTPTRNRSNSITGSLKINEIYYDVVGNEPSGEYIELFNTGNEGLNISAWILRNDQRVTFDFNAEISSNDFFIVENTDSDIDEQSYQDCFGQYGLAGDEDFVVLENAAGQTVDRVTYSSVESSDYFNDTGQNVGYADSAPDVSEGNSLGRYPDGVDTDNDTVDFMECVVTREDSNTPIVERISIIIIVLFIIIFINIKQRMKSDSGRAIIQQRSRISSDSK